MFLSTLNGWSPVEYHDFLLPKVGLFLKANWNIRYQFKDINGAVIEAELALMNDHYY